LQCLSTFRKYFAMLAGCLVHRSEIFEVMRLRYVLLLLPESSLNIFMMFNSRVTCIIWLYGTLRCTPTANVSGRQHLWSASQRKLIILRYGLNSFGRWCFAVAGPSTWNSLPDSLRDPALSLNMFRRQLKTYFFCEILTICTQRIRGLLITRRINLHCFSCAWLNYDILRLLSLSDLFVWALRPQHVVIIYLKIVPPHIFLLTYLVCSIPQQKKMITQQH